MRDYEELVKRLREEAECPDNFPEDSNLMREAADVIEELIAQRRGTEEAVKVMQMEIDRLLASRTPKED